MDHVETVQSIYAAFGRGDLPAILDALADDVAWDQRTPSHGLPWYQPRSGRDEVTGFFADLMENAVLHRLEPLNFLTGGNQVAAVMDYAIEVKGSPEVIEDIEIHLWTFDQHGKISAFNHVCDRHAQVVAYRSVHAG
jgi:ketosteroid isomerase-like protein